MISFAPLLIWHNTTRHKFDLVKLLESILIIALAGVVGQVLFLNWLHDTLGLVARGYWMFLFVTLVALRAGAIGTIIVILLTAVQALSGALMHLGFFNHDLEQTALTNYFSYLLSLSSDGLLVAMLFTQDNQDRKLLAKARDDARHTAQLLQTTLNERADLLHRIPIGVYRWRFLHNGTSRFDFVSPAWCHQLGVSEQEVMENDQVAFAVIHPEDQERFFLDIQSANATLSQFSWTGRIFRNQETRWISIDATPSVEQNDIVWNGVQADISERHQAEEAIRQAREAAEAANLAKSHFLANMSHEIRTPMNAILGMADLLWESELQPEQQKYVKIFRSAGENLLSIINDILDLSKIEAGQLILEQIPFNPAEEARVVCDMLQLRANAKGLHLVYHVHPNVPEWLLGDPTRLRQILLNLLGNAVKFTERGSILLELNATNPSQPPDDEKIWLYILVKDSGIGIAEERLSKIFDHFVQADSSTTRRYGGTGLGLSIVNKLLNQMGGTIRVESQIGNGSSFHLTIPLAKAQPVAAQPALQLQGVRILLVDDNAANRILFQSYLEPTQATVDEAENALSAMQKLEKSICIGNPYHLVLLDIRMPQIDGLQLLQLWRSTHHSQFPVLILTSEHQESFLHRCQELGVHDYLIKPIRRIDLLQAIANRLPEIEQFFSSFSTPALPTQTAIEPKRILLVDDSEDNRLLISAYLKESEFILQTVENGAEALEQLNKNPFDLVLMDVQMPVMDGYAATRAWRRSEKQENRERIPIIALTAHALSEDVAHSLQAGCNAHLTKPIKKKILLETIRQQLKRPKQL
ncbi:response regulator [Candidatus Magnetaquicoccus inordinatus]|uniref:response regulator n=1 Tax=Candidatus Magnetaquicoccus inordinatus TaxID=2496818 RepID=UPI00187D26D9|nr:response regulator [Candidatus Magnetaquicoccus inordinatus]